MRRAFLQDWAVDAAGKKKDDSGTAYTLDDDRRSSGTLAQIANTLCLCPVDVNGDGRFTSAEFGMQPRDIPTLCLFLAARVYSR